ncbi:uncharacterized protein LOC112454342 [Temnothorax curvispinosus]|uniref:Uncharacterized protein LOC112454342 n=2 Tax=Temnothorax TaxID=300110 RepID=A0A6J1PQ57_9HYME|nr:uncharacterized protein LOC112454342 [Temnothorax curvispinosus]TGZ56201.1 Uncharacterized protein DBV15_01717 [Temnothorax longispinosus]
MGLKWFRASLSMEEEAAKVPEMTGFYRRVSYFESAIPKNAEVSGAPSSIISDSTASDDNETVQYDRSKADLTSQLSSSITDSDEITVKDNDKKLQINNHAVENAEPSTSIKDPNVKEQSTCGDESNKITEDRYDMSNTKSPISSDNELVI